MGRQKGIALQWRAGDYRGEFIPKMKLEVVVDDKDAETVIDLICDVAQTGEAGDGKIIRLSGGGCDQGEDEGEGVHGGLECPWPPFPLSEN